MSERSRNIAVGITALIGLVGLVGLIMLFGYTPRFLEKGYIVTVRMPYAGGLSPGNRVQLNGIDIGRVESVSLRDLPDVGVKVRVKVRPEIRLPADAVISVQSPLFGGSPVLAFDLNGLTAEQLGQLLPDDDSAVADGQVRTMAEALSADLRDALAGPAGDLSRLTESFRELSAEWSQVGRNINLLVEPRSPDAVDQGDFTGNLATILQRADSRLAELKTTLASVNAILQDEQLLADVRATAAHAASLTRKLDDGAEALMRQYLRVADTLNGAIASMQQTLDRAREGQGTVGRLLNDPALYNNLNDAAQRLGRALEDFSSLIEKLKKEGLVIEF